MAFLSDYSMVEMLFAVGCILVLSFLLAEWFDWTKLFSTDMLCQYDYTVHNGPHTWKEKFPQSKGNNQSPINISSTYSIEVPVETESSIQFSSEYYSLPKYMGIANDSHGIVLYGCWSNCAFPTVNGGPVHEPHQFVNARFRWGPNKNEGSEHTIDNVRFAMEIQAVHVKPEFRCCSLTEAAEQNAVLILSYFYKVTPVDNPYIDMIISQLERVQYPFSQVQIEPVPLSWITPPFTSRYYSYVGSLTHPPCTEGVNWLIASKPLGISVTQMRKFKKICTFAGNILESNTRPVQDVNCRDIYYYA